MARAARWGLDTLGPSFRRKDGRHCPWPCWTRRLSWRACASWTCIRWVGCAGTRSCQEAVRRLLRPPPPGAHGPHHPEEGKGRPGRLQRPGNAGTYHRLFCNLNGSVLRMPELQFQCATSQFLRKFFLVQILQTYLQSGLVSAIPGAREHLLVPGKCHVGTIDLECPRVKGSVQGLFQEKQGLDHTALAAAVGTGQQSKGLDLQVLLLAERLVPFDCQSGYLPACHG